MACLWPHEPVQERALECVVCTYSRLSFFATNVCMVYTIDRIIVRFSGMVFSTSMINIVCGLRLDRHGLASLCFFLGLVAATWTCNTDVPQAFIWALWWSRDKFPIPLTRIYAI